AMRAVCRFGTSTKARFGAIRSRARPQAFASCAFDNRPNRDHDMMNITPAAALLLGLVSMATASAQSDSPAAPARPAYQPQRFLEDWSILARGTPTDADVWDRIKYIPLADDESVSLSLGGSMRFRAEHWSDF